MNINTEKHIPPARLIVCEREGRWAAALRRELAAAGVRVWETRTTDDLLEELEASPASFILLQMCDETIGTLRFIARARLDFPAARLAVAAERRQVALEWLVREAGAVHFLCSPRQVGPLARMACRHLAQAPPPPQRSLPERIWAALPWGGAGER